MYQNECSCWQEVSELTEEWEPVKIWLYTFSAFDQAHAVMQVRDERNELVTSVTMHYCPKCGRYLG